ncbi:hydrogen peroxide-inducible genes activator [Pendulispora albinea]|uniref:Hydrogen peroxide-inducible genes activator n=1 Tax=Pendulispora albinea TaxID=2741071 RepID=A0ABZ2M424_9BACT
MDLSGLTLTQLRYLLAVDEHRSFRGAAESCHVSQPALSMQIRRLEEILGVRLFDRETSPVVTTDVGTRVVTQARLVLRECARFPDVAQSFDMVSGSYRLGVIPTLARTLIPRLVTSFTKAYPRVHLVIEELPTDLLVRRLLEDTMDGGLAVTPLGIPAIHERHLGFERFFVYLSPKHALTKLTEIRQSDLVEYKPWLLSEEHCFRTQILHLCSVDMRPEPADGGIRFEAGSLDTLVDIVDTGHGLTLLPELVAARIAPERKSQLRPFAPPVPVRRISLIHSRQQERRPLTDALLSTLSERLPASLRRRATDAVIPPTLPAPRRKR